MTVMKEREKEREINMIDTGIFTEIYGYMCTYTQRACG